MGFAVTMPDCKGETHMAEIEVATVKAIIFCSDEFTRNNDLSRFGELVQIDHQAEFIGGESHFTGSRREAGTTQGGCTRSATASTAETSRRSRLSTSSGTITVSTIRYERRYQPGLIIGLLP